MSLTATGKAYIDNYLEGYPRAVGTPVALRRVGLQPIPRGTFRYYSAQISPLKPVVPGTKRRYDPATDGKALYYWLFPNLTINIYPDNINLKPGGSYFARKTLIVFEWFVREDKMPTPKATGPRSLHLVIRYSMRILASANACRRASTQGRTAAGVTP